MSRYGDQFDFKWGVDEVLYSALPFGPTSAVGSTYNYAAPIYRKMIKAFNAGDVSAARHEAGRAIELVDILLEYGVMQAGKALMTLRGVECGPTRSPLLPLSEARREELFNRVLDRKLLDPVPEIVIKKPSNPRISKQS